MEGEAEQGSAHDAISWGTIAITVAATAVLLGYLLTWLERVANASSAKGTKSLVERVAGWTTKSAPCRLLKSNPIFRLFVHIWHFAVALLEFEPRHLGFSWLAMDNRSIRERETLLLGFFWHFAALLPMVVVLMVAYFLKVEKEELYLFFCVAAATASLEICIGVLIRKSERINMLSQQTTLARERFDGVRLKNWILFFQIMHREARNSLAKAAYVTGLSLVLFSSIAVLETLRMKQAAGLTEQQIADVLQKHVQSEFDAKSPDPNKPPEPVPDKGPSSPYREGATITQGGQSCGLSYAEAAKKLKEAHEEARKKDIGNDKAVFSILCAVVMLLLAGRKVWIESAHAEDRNPLDVYQDPLDGLAVLVDARKFRSFIAEPELVYINEQRSISNPSDHC